MKILKAGVVIAELPDKPQNFEGSCKRGRLTLVIGDNEVTIAEYDSQDTARTVLFELRKQYLDGAGDIGI